MIKWVKWLYGKTCKAQNGRSVNTDRAENRHGREMVKPTGAHKWQNWRNGKSAKRVGMVMAKTLKPEGPDIDTGATIPRPTPAPVKKRDIDFVIPRSVEYRYTGVDASGWRSASRSTWRRVALLRLLRRAGPGWGVGGAQKSFSRNSI